VATKTKKTAKPIAVPVFDQDQGRDPRNGLTAEEETALRQCSRELGAIYERRAYLGKHEAKAAFDLKQRIDTRLNPPTPQELRAETAAMIESYTQHEALSMAIAAAAVAEVLA
jgi:hypothetical protein